MDVGGSNKDEPLTKEQLKAENKKQEVQFKAQHGLVVAFFTLILAFHVLGVYLFCSGFLLSRLVLADKSQCAAPPVELDSGHVPGSLEAGCWHPRSFDKAVIILVDALRYDFTVPFRPRPGDERPHHFHNALPVLYETASRQPQNAFLRPFIADPPTTTLQRLKALTVGTLPTFIDAGSNFAGTAIDEDNLVQQLYDAGKKVVHLGDDTWHSLFPGLFEPNLTRPYDSFNVWDLHTVDNGVNEHLFPLLEPDMEARWDVIFGHYLGVDHAGHRYGPDHPAMTEKLKQMDDVFRRLIDKIDDRTLLVVMGDHGMDVKGDHGGESDDEVEAALWMYSKKPSFGRTDPAFIAPPATAKERSVWQIDLVPTLSILLGMPVPFNNLGHPIEEAFIGKGGKDFENLARVSRLTAAQIRRYQDEYTGARSLDKSNLESTADLWTAATQSWQGATRKSRSAPWKAIHDAFSAYSAENLRICRSLWARFDLVSMSMGIVILTLNLAVIVMYARGLQTDHQSIAPIMFGWGLGAAVAGAAVAASIAALLQSSVLQYASFGAAVAGNVGISLGFLPAREVLRLPVPRDLWSWLCLVMTAMLCGGFGSNSFTIFEDEQLLFLLVTIGILMLGSSLGQPDGDDRWLGALNAISLVVATRLASLSRLCREEQMPYCRSTYYASATSSTSAGWQLILPFAVALLLPSAISYFYRRTKNYQGSAVIWIGIALRVGLVLAAVFWTIEVAEDDEWFPNFSKDKLKTYRVLIAQIVLAVAFAAGYSTFIWASPLLAVVTEEADAPAQTTSKPISDDDGAPILTTVKSAPAQPRSKLIIFGYANTHGTRYFLLPCAWLLALILLQKPMGQGTMALLAISILNVLEIVEANKLRHSALGPTVLALLGSFYYFKTGHQATLASIQWDTAFIPLRTVKYPWTPLIVVANTFGAQILCALAVPTIAMWKVPPKSPGLLGRVARAMATHYLFYAAVALATVIEAAWLRRHLMLYRIFMPRMLMAVIVLAVVEFVGGLIAVMGIRWSIVSVTEVFGWM